MRVVRTIYASSRQIRADSLNAVKTALPLFRLVIEVIATDASSANRLRSVGGRSRRRFRILRNDVGRMSCARNADLLK
jgi:hypothetical protein